MAGVSILIYKLHDNNNFFLHREAARFCFGPVIQQELDCLSREWNHHRIRRYNLSEMPSGIPEILYHLPETAGTCIYITTDNIII